MQIGNRNISTNDAPLIIAEIGINHGGNLNVAKEMVKKLFHLGVNVSSTRPTSLKMR